MGMAVRDSKSAERKPEERDTGTPGMRPEARHAGTRGGGRCSAKNEARSGRS